MSRPVRWLHISDLHLGSAGQELWWTVRRDFEHSVKEWVGKLGIPDLILVSGDLSNTGQRKEFTLFDRFLDDLLKWIGEPAPLVIPVPGNHDVQRPDAEYRFAFLDGYGAKGNPGLEQDFWEQRDTGAIAPLFDEYTRWLKRRVRHWLGSGGWRRFRRGWSARDSESPCRPHRLDQPLHLCREDRLISLPPLEPRRQAGFHYRLPEAALPAVK
jgi:predicted MPP superfamily phosphohydrolase